jgi:ATP-dependent DNA helicase RecG
MDAQSISLLLADLESDRVERTVSTTNTDKFGEAICAFSNDFPNHRRPGYLIVGADDKTGKPSGLTVTDQLLQNLAAVRSDGNIQPLPAMIVQKITLDDGMEVAVVEVHPADLPPVRYKGRVWIRVGPRRAIATEQEESLLSEKRLSAARTFDARPCMEATVADLSVRLFESYRAEAVADEIITENHRSLEQQLTSLRFVDAGRGVPTNAGILAFGLNPRYFLPGAYIQYLQFPGTEMTDLPIDHAEVAGDLRSMVEEMLLRLKVINRHQLRQKTALQEETLPLYPDVALREILLNAVAHRSYESNTPIRFTVFADRVEISSPGGLYGEVNKSNFGTESSYRNPVVAEVLKVLGFVNRFGYGLRRAERALAENGNRPLDAVISESGVLIRLWARGDERSG